MFSPFFGFPLYANAVQLKQELQWRLYDNSGCIANRQPWLCVLNEISLTPESQGFPYGANELLIPHFFPVWAITIHRIRKHKEVQLPKQGRYGFGGS